MRKPLPVIHEPLDELKERFKQERHPARQQRLHALFLLATHGGLASLLALYVPAGKRSPLTLEQLAQLQEALQQPTGFGSYGEIRQWINTTFGIQLSYNAVHKVVRYKLRAKLNVPRPSHTKKR